LILIPDQVRDPGNLGTILRAAWAAGVWKVLLPPGTVDPLSPKVLRAAMGAHFYLPILRLSWEESP
jgi:TrmH family RNA methyltransferase